MRRLVVCLFFTALVISTLCAHAEPSDLHFEVRQWNFGRIEEDGGIVSHVFCFQNRSGHPIVLLDVVATCGCTKPTFSKRPVRPGEMSEIEVSYDPMNRPGAFNRQVTVYTSEGGDPIRLQIVGEVIPRKRSIEELYPCDWGGGIRATAFVCDMGMVPHGSIRQTAVEIVNTSLRPLDLRPLQPKQSGWLSVTLPSRLEAGERASINLLYDLPDTCRYYGTLSDEVALAIDGRRVGASLMVRGVAVDNPLLYSDNSHPSVHLNKNIVKFGPVKRASGQQTQWFELSNTGERALTVRAVECRVFSCSLQSGISVPAGGTVSVAVRLDPSQCEDGIAVERLRIVTDDPEHPLTVVRATAVIEE